ncbi:Nuclear envelope morphology protein 1 [Leucoagaricus sp. SymC.cos]|nr:Nuclear envelope morphology protein 1 [Leucoagaricus sp. SymC.cos]
MNSLSYLSRQFDVLAAARTPPSTPSTELPPPPFPADRPRPPLQRTLSFLYPIPPRSSSKTRPRRTKSSPAIPPPRPFSASEPPPLQAPQRSKPRHQLDTVINQVFFIRLFLLVWDKVNSAWATFLEQLDLYAWTWRRPVSVFTVTSEKGKEKEIQAIEEVAVVIPYDDPKLESQLASRASTSSPEGSPVPASRASTPLIHGRRTHFGQKTLVLDLDETLIHSTSRPNPSLASSGSGFFGLGLMGKGNKSGGHTVEVILGDKRTQYHVYKRPFVDFFLRTVSGWYTLVIFTASMQEYADPVVDWLDAGRGILVQRFFRDSCTQLPNGSYTKDLSIVEKDLSQVCLVDNSPISYKVNEANGIPIEGWTDDPSDEALLDLLPVLDSLRFTKDVRHILSLRSAGLHAFPS